MEAIVLAGGFGTRLKSVVKDVPKPMADINGKPFLVYLFNYLVSNGVSKVILSVGYKQNVIKKYFSNNYNGLNILYSSEETPLGTGGAIKRALTLVGDETQRVLILNGDTFFNVNLKKLKLSSMQNQFNIILSLKLMKDFDRYGSVRLKDERVVGFEEKKFFKKAYINGGVYLVKKDILDNMEKLFSFSFEKFIEDNLKSLNIYSFKDDGYFIDIGIPEDYEKAKIDFKELF